MSPEQATALIVAVTGLIAAIGVVAVQLVQVKKQINGRLTELIATTKLAAQKDGELAGRDFARDATRATHAVGEQSELPIERSHPSS
jgi:hypothetical protein